MIDGALALSKGVGNVPSIDKTMGAAVSGLKPSKAVEGSLLPVKKRYRDLDSFATETNMSPEAAKSQDRIIEMLHDSIPSPKKARPSFDTPIKATGFSRKVSGLKIDLAQAKLNANSKPWATPAPLTHAHSPVGPWRPSGVTPPSSPSVLASVSPGGSSSPKLHSFLDS